MRSITILIILLVSSFTYASQLDTIAEESYKLIGDSIFLPDGTSCHIDNYINGKCETENNWWDINYLSFWTGLLIPFVFFAYIAITVKRKINKKRAD